MRNIILLGFLLLISCRSDNNESKNLSKNAFAFEPGTYYISGNNGTDILKIREFEDGSLTFCVTDGNKTLYDYGSSKTFSKYQTWGIFRDEKDNFWFYNSDIGDHIILVKDTLSEGYVAREFPADTVMPAKFKKWMDK